MIRVVLIGALLAHHIAHDHLAGKGNASASGSPSQNGGPS